MDVSVYQAKVYPSPPCWALVSDVLTTEQGLEVKVYRTVTDSIRDIAAAFRLELHKGVHGLQRLDGPSDFAVVLMGKTEKLGFHHCGVWYQGKVLHAQDNGTYYEDPTTIGDEYELIEYWGIA